MRLLYGIPFLLLLICPGLKCGPISPTFMEYKEAIDAIFAVTLRLEALMTNNTSSQQNFLVSPISAAMIIGQLMLGAEGEFQEELHNLLSISGNKKNTQIIRENTLNGQVTTEVLPYGLLHLQLSSLAKQFNKISKNSSFTLEVANALFYNRPIKLKQKFVKNLKTYYNSEITPLNFSTEPLVCQKFINNWGSEHTNGLIPTVLPEPVPVSTSSVFANAIYFKGNWLTPFSDKLNVIGPFRTSQKETVNVTYMQNFIEDIPYFESKKYKCTLLSLPYEDKDLGLYILLPDENNENAFNINAFSQSLKASDLLDMIYKADIHDVSIKIPKMSLSNSINLIDPLKKYHAYIKSRKPAVTVNKQAHVKGVFRDKAFKDSIDDLEQKVDDFKNFNQVRNVEDIVLSNAAENQNLVISNLFQEITFSINEKGTEAAAISAGIIDYMGGIKVVNIDRPFVFFLRHEVTSATLFWGTIYNPSK